jgi:hypothetical protein|tara:strand:- start:5982 stop:6134 length:153 start_codon:yes stop_codon:yes gene_type:complete
METFEDYMNKKKYEDLVNEILDLKMKHPLSEEDKLKLQKLQQKLNGRKKI